MAFQVRRRLVEAKRGAWDCAADWSAVWVSFGDSWYHGADPLPVGRPRHALGQARRVRRPRPLPPRAGRGPGRRGAPPDRGLRRPRANRPWSGPTRASTLGACSPSTARRTTRSSRTPSGTTPTRRAASSPAPRAATAPSGWSRWSTPRAARRSTSSTRPTCSGSTTRWTSATRSRSSSTTPTPPPRPTRAAPTSAWPWSRTPTTCWSARVSTGITTARWSSGRIGSSTVT